MGGVGSFTRMNRTLYIGRIKESRNTAEVIERHFEEFGDIERSLFLFPFSLSLFLFLSWNGKLMMGFFGGLVKILQSRGVAFVTYVSELNAQFAKEAMMCQSLDEDEVINVRFVLSVPFSIPSPDHSLTLTTTTTTDGQQLIPTLPPLEPN